MRWLLATMLLGCATHADVVLPNPLATGHVAPNSIAKLDRKTERARGLPADALTHWASLTKLSAADVCFDVVLRTLVKVALADVRATLEAPDRAAVERAQLWPDEPKQRDFDGRVPERTERGFEAVCTKRDHAGICLEWGTQPIYVTTLRPGRVTVFEARGSLCFPDTIVTTETPTLELALTAPGQETERYRFGFQQKGTP